MQNPSKVVSQQISFFQSFRGSMLMLFLAVAIIPALIIGVISYYISQTSLSDRIQEEMLRAAKMQSKQVDRWLEAKLGEVKAIAKTKRIISLNPASAKEALDGYFTEWKDYELLFATDTTGKTFAASDGKEYQLSDRDYWQKAIKGEANISEPLISRASGSVAIVFAAPLIDSEGKIIGVTGGVVSTAALAEELKAAQFGSTGEVYLINNQKLLISPIRFTEPLFQMGLIKERPELELIVDTFASRQALSGKEGKGIYTDYRNERVLGAFQPLQVKSWALIIEQDEKEALQPIFQLRNIIIAVILLITLLVAAMSFFVTQQFSNPIQLITQGAQHLAVGDVEMKDMDWKAIAKVIARKDELGLIGRSFSQLIEYFREMAGIAQALAEGNMTVVVHPHSTNDILGNAFSKMAAEISAMITQLTKEAIHLNLAAEQLSQAAEQTEQVSFQISATIQQVAKGVGDQTHSTTETAASVEELSRAIDGIAKGAQEQAGAVNKASELTSQINDAVNQVAENADAVLQGSSIAAQLAHDGFQKVEQTVNSMESIREKVNILAEKIQGMGNRSAEIGTILDVIDDIASQTNLLALNAAIEAARAGEHGKSFAVVADEVRKLAERAAQSTREIAELIRTIQNSIAESTSAMDISRNQVEQGVNYANEAGNSLDQILAAAANVQQQAQLAKTAVEKVSIISSKLSEAMDTISAIVEENSAASEQMAASSNTVTEAIESIASISEENSAAVEEVSASTEELNAQAEELAASVQELSQMSNQLTAAVARFRLSDEKDHIALFKQAHLKWVTQLDQMLAGKTYMSETGNHTTCSLGTWYYSNSTKDLRELREFQDLEAPHIAFHENVQKAISAFQRSNNKDAQAFAKQAEQLSHTIISLLDSLERKMKTS